MSFMNTTTEDDKKNRNVVVIVVSKLIRTRMGHNKTVRFVWQACRQAGGRGIVVVVTSRLSNNVAASVCACKVAVTSERAERGYWVRWLSVGRVQLHAC